MEEIVSTGVIDGMVRIVASEEYDSKPQEKTMSYCEVAEKIVTQRQYDKEED